MSGDHNQYQKGKSYLDEPIAWMHTTGTGHVYFRKKPQDKVFNPQPVFTSPPKREWAGLTDEERHSIREWQEIQKELGPVWAPMMLYLYLAIESKLKEKNT
jgi:hypothetical protein